MSMNYKWEREACLYTKQVSLHEESCPIRHASSTLITSLTNYYLWLLSFTLYLYYLYILFVTLPPSSKSFVLKACRWKKAWSLFRLWKSFSLGTVIFVDTSWYDLLSDKQNCRTEKGSDHPKLIFCIVFWSLEFCNDLLA